MAMYQLLFGSVDWPEPDERPKNAVVPTPERTEKLSVRVPRALKGYLEEAAEREGLSAEAWAAQVLARSVRPNGATAR
jgi:predicted HicB family RNase H-like nuclease